MPDFGGAARGDTGRCSGALGLVWWFAVDGQPFEEGAGGGRGVEAARRCLPGRPRYGGGGGLFLKVLAPPRHECRINGGMGPASTRSSLRRRHIVVCRGGRTTLPRRRGDHPLPLRRAGRPRRTAARARALRCTGRYCRELHLRSPAPADPLLRLPRAGERSASRPSKATTPRCRIRPIGRGPRQPPSLKHVERPLEPAWAHREQAPRVLKPRPRLP